MFHFHVNCSNEVEGFWKKVKNEKKIIKYIINRILILKQKIKEYMFISLLENLFLEIFLSLFCFVLLSYTLIMSLYHTHLPICD